MKIVEEIGLPAALEQLAEEAAELAQAALKLSRKIRKENPTPKDVMELAENLEEEYGDVLTCGLPLLCAEIEGRSILNLKRLDREIDYKMDRWENRIRQSRRYELEKGKKEPGKVPAEMPPGGEETEEAAERSAAGEAGRNSSAAE